MQATQIGNEISASRLESPSEVVVAYTLILPNVEFVGNEISFKAMLVETTIFGSLPIAETVIKPNAVFIPVECVATVAVF